MSDFDDSKYGNNKPSNDLEALSNVEKNSKAWSNAFSHWVDFGKLQKGIFTDFIEWSIKALFTLLCSSIFLIYIMIVK